MTNEQARTQEAEQARRQRTPRQQLLSLLPAIKANANYLLETEQVNDLDADLRRRALARAETLLGQAQQVRDLLAARADAE